MENTKKFWTNEEDLVIISHVRKHPHNLFEAFKLASVELERTVPAVKLRWYRNLKRTHSNVFMLVSQDVVTTNSKCNSLDNNCTLSKNTITVWNKIINNKASIPIYEHKKYYVWIKDKNKEISSPLSINTKEK